MKSFHFQNLDAIQSDRHVCNLREEEEEEEEDSASSASCGQGYEKRAQCWLLRQGAEQISRSETCLRGTINSFYCKNVPVLLLSTKKIQGISGLKDVSSRGKRETQYKQYKL